MQQWADSVCVFDEKHILNFLFESNDRLIFKESYLKPLFILNEKIIILPQLWGWKNEFNVLSFKEVHLFTWLVSNLNGEFKNWTHELKQLNVYKYLKVFYL